MLGNRRKIDDTPHVRNAEVLKKNHLPPNRSQILHQENGIDYTLFLLGDRCWPASGGVMVLSMGDETQTHA
jgi:hypothetical protein